MRFSPLVLLLLAASCGPHQVNREQYLHSLTVGKDGEPAPLRVMDPDDTIPEYPKEDFSVQIDRIVREPRFQKARRFVIYVHGGMNMLVESLRRTGQILEVMGGEEKGLADEDRDYPLFINWNSGFPSSYWDHLYGIRGGQRVPWWYGVLTLPGTLVSDVGRGVARTPLSLWVQLHGTYTYWTVGALPPKGGWEGQVGIDFRYEQPWSFHLINVLTAPFLLTLPLTTMIEEWAAASAYEMMERRTEMLFRTDEDLTRGKLFSPTSRAPSGALIQLMKRIPEGKPVILIGHSMGTIVLNELIRRFPRHHYETVVYMAAACTLKDFMDTLPPYLMTHRETKFYSLSLHPVADVRENSAYNLLPSGSLLDWLDRFVLRPRTALYTTLGKWNNVMAYLEAMAPELQAVKNQVHFKSFPVVGDDYPRVHGDFDDFKFWHPRYWDPKDMSKPERIR